MSSADAPVGASGCRWSAPLAVGLGQVIWIATEMLMVRGADWLQFVYGGLGLLIVLLSFQPSLRRYLAPGTAWESSGENVMSDLHRNTARAR